MAHKEESGSFWRENVVECHVIYLPMLSCSLDFYHHISSHELSVTSFMRQSSAYSLRGTCNLNKSRNHL